MQVTQQLFSGSEGKSLRETGSYVERRYIWNGDYRINRTLPSRQGTSDKVFRHRLKGHGISEQD